jgi:hypothetical protein
MEKNGLSINIVDAAVRIARGRKTRLKNGLSRIGLPKMDRELAKTRIAALNAIQQVYGERQQAALSSHDK